jgi:hypothetical protein
MNSSTRDTFSFLRPMGLYAALFALLASTALFLSGCGNSTATTPVTNTVTSNVAVQITDAPSDQVVALSLTINSIVLTDTAGKTASILNSPATIEACHLDAVSEPLLNLSIPQDTYVSATITTSNPQVAYVNSSGVLTTATAILDGNPTTVVFGPPNTTLATPITISNSTQSLMFDLLVAQSVAISGTTVTVTPEFHISPVTNNPAGPPIPGNGGSQGFIGTVASFTNGSMTDFILTTPNGAALTIFVNNATVWQGLTGLSALTAGMVLDVDAVTQTDGTLLALRVHAENPKDTRLITGPVTKVNGTPATSFTMVLRQQVGAGIAATIPVNVTVTGSTVFDTAAQLNLTPGGPVLPVAAPPFTPTFNASTLIPGQHVAVVASAAAPPTATAAATATADNVTLLPQTINGTITAITTSGSFTVYTLSLPAQSPLTLLDNFTTATVYTYSGTMTQNMPTPPTVGTNARFNGLLFDSGGSLKMISIMLAPPPGTPMVP